MPNLSNCTLNPRERVRWRERERGWKSGKERKRQRESKKKLREEKLYSAICAQVESDLMPYFDLTPLLHRDRKGKSRQPDRQTEMQNPPWSSDLSFRHRKAYCTKLKLSSRSSHSRRSARPLVLRTYSKKMCPPVLTVFHVNILVTKANKIHNWLCDYIIDYIIDYVFECILFLLNGKNK